MESYGALVIKLSVTGKRVAVQRHGVSLGLGTKVTDICGVFDRVVLKVNSGSFDTLVSIWSRTQKLLNV